jgi:hypothetical protein
LKIEEAYEIIEEWENWESVCCTCHCGNPPCSKCTDQPSEEEYEEANAIIEQFEKENEPMNEIIIEMYPKTKDAVLIQKWFGERIANEPLFRILLKGKENEILEEAKRLEAGPVAEQKYP